MEMDNGFVAGQAALKAESSKVAKHEKACLENQHVFIPFAFDTFGFLAPEAEEFLNRVQRVVQNSAGMRLQHRRLYLHLNVSDKQQIWTNIQQISLTGFPAQSVGSSNTEVLDLSCLLVLITGTSQSRQHESRKSPTAELFEVDSGRISIRHCGMLKNITLNVLAESQG
ncbi:hypothetical protein Tco_0797222 [Tanacetum coccineum]